MEAKCSMWRLECYWKKVKNWWVDRKWKERNLRGEFKDLDQQLRFYYGACPKCSRPTVNRMCPSCGWDGINPIPI